MNPDSAIGRFVDRHRWIRLAVAVFTRTTDLNGNYVANALTLIGFIALFPMILLIVSVMGLITGSNPNLTGEIIDFLGLQGQAAQTFQDILTHASASGKTGSIIGLIGLAWSGLSLVGALRYAVNLPQGRTIKGLRARAMGIPWLLGAGLIFLVSIGLAAIGNWLPGWAAPVITLGNLVIDIALFAWTFWFLDFDRPPVRHLLPGAIAAAIGFGVLKIGASLILPSLVANSSAIYGGLGAVFAILAWLLIFSRLFVYAVVFNTVLAEDRSEDGSGPLEAAQDP